MTLSLYLPSDRKAHGTKEYQETEEIFDVGSIVIDDSPDKEMINSSTGQKHMADDNEDYGFQSTPATEVHDQSRQTPSLDSPEAFLSGDIQPFVRGGSQLQNNLSVVLNQHTTVQMFSLLSVETQASQLPSTGYERHVSEESSVSSPPIDAEC
ncbi:hypothetical protein HPB50_003603 [Hyalomma asiaticum]|uniref:Uncharacterized protein n=1 Tax=Hyalomma asiaticum TaxID=266040 RepID=A0ACB7T3E9_HYAAI|nr:hypothetical protein HPB50_003603 [Hyalomma asiaticum]